MNLNQKAKELINMRGDFTKFFDRVSSVMCTDDLVLELMQMRKYKSESMFNLLKKEGVFKLDYISELTLIDNSVTTEQLKLWGLMNERGNYLLKGRYVVPIRDINGKVAALVGWYPDSRKYVTTPTYGFSKDTLFFNMDCYSLANKKGYCFLVEGIYDTLAIKSLGEPVLGNMGLPLSLIKSNMLKRYGKKTICIPDNDKAGLSCIPFANKLSGKKSKNIWIIENEHVFVYLPKGVKDCDDFVNEFDVIDDFNKCISAKTLIKLKEE